MGLYRRAGSPFWWMNLAAPGQAPVQRSTKIRHDAPSKEQRAEHKRQADAVLARAQAELTMARLEAPKKPAIRLSKYLAWYGTHVADHLKGKTRVRSILRRLSLELGELQVHELTRARVLEWRTARVKVVAASTVNREVDVLKSALGHAVPTYLEASPIRGLSRLKHAEAQRQVISRADESALLAVLAPADAAIVVAAIDTLIRAGDLLRLTWADDAGRYVRVRDPKTGTPYEVPVSRRLRAALDALPRRGTRIFGHHPNSTSLWRMLLAGCAAAHVAKGLTFHGLRHTGASRLVEAGVDLRTVQAIGGWKSLTQLTRYAHPTADHVRAAVETIGAGVVTPHVQRTKRDGKAARFYV